VNMPTAALSCGPALSIAGADSGQTAVATKFGGVLVFDVGGVSPTFQQTIPCSELYRGEVSFSSDGDVLVVGTQANDDALGQVRVFDMPAASLVHAWQYTTDFFVSARVSANGSRVGQVTGHLGGSGNYVYALRQTDVTGASTFFSANDATGQPVLMSPDGSHLVVAQKREPGFSTKFYANGTLTNSVEGYAVGWLDDNSVLLDKYVFITTLSYVYAGSEIRDATGALLETPPLPEIVGFGRPSSTSVYAEKSNAIYDLATGQALWSRPVGQAPRGAVAGTHIVYAVDARLRAELF
jgi:hypothetical protein